MRRSIYHLSILLVIFFRMYQAMIGITYRYMAMVLLTSHQPISWAVIGPQERLLGRMVSGDRLFWDGQVVQKDVDVNVVLSPLRGNWKSCNLALVFLCYSHCYLLPLPVGSKHALSAYDHDYAHAQ
jgi:hypothetical protein